MWAKAFLEQYPSIRSIELPHNGDPIIEYRDGTKTPMSKLPKGMRDELSKFINNMRSLS